MATQHCPQCRHLWPGYCAPLRCYCGHPQCPAFRSYVELEQPKTPTTVRPATSTAWDDRDSPTWIDNL